MEKLLDIFVKGWSRLLATRTRFIKEEQKRYRETSQTEWSPSFNRPTTDRSAAGRLLANTQFIAAYKKNLIVCFLVALVEHDVPELFCTALSG